MPAKSKMMRRSQNNLSSSALTFIDASSHASSLMRMSEEFTISTSSGHSVGERIPMSTIRKPSTRRLSSNSFDSLTVNKLRFSMIGMYGREKEKQKLIDCLNRSTLPSTERKRELILISGESGTGKTALAKTLKHDINKRKGIFVAGKFNLNRQEEPYAAILAACVNLTSQIMEWEVPRFEKFRSELLGQLGEDLDTLVHVIPYLGQVMGIAPVPGHEEMIPAMDEAKNRFKYLFRKFFRVIGKLLDPFVLVLDDLQWADSPSLDLLEVLLTDRGNTHLIVIGCYRSNEINSTHMLNVFMRDIKTQSKDCALNVTEVEIGNLSLDDTTQILLDLLSADEPRTSALAKICQQKTHGNVFFLIQFLHMLHERDLLEYNLGLTIWVWDEERIRQETGATENVADFLKEKLAVLPPNTIQLLQLAACLGASFHQDTLIKLWEALTQQRSGPLERNSFRESLCVALDEGLIEKHISMTYRWAHDKIQEAAFNLIPPKQLESLQFEIGEVLIHQMDEHSHRESIFVAVNLLNAGTPPFVDYFKRVELAELNLLAAETAVKVSAHDIASKYIKRGVRLLPDDSWVEQYQTALQLHCFGAEVEGFLGHVTQMERHCHQVIQEGKSLFDKLRVYHVLLDSTAGRGRVPEAITLCLDVLKMLGCTFPESKLIINMQTIIGILQFQARSDLRTPKEIAKLSAMTDRRRIEVMRLLDKLATYCYLSENILFAITILTRLNYTARYGLCDSSPIDFAGLGMILTGKLFDFQAGSTYARYSLLLLEKLDARKIHARTMMVAYGFVLPWTQPSRSVLKYLIKAYETGLQTGDTESAMYAIMSYMYTSFQSGKSLHTIEEDGKIYLRQMKELKQFKALNHTKTILQTVMNLMGNSKNASILTGDIMDQDTMVDEATNDNDKVTLTMIQAFQTQLFALFGRHQEGAIFAISHGDDLADKIPCSTLVAVDPFFRAISLFSMARQTKKRKYIRHAKKARKTIKKYAKNGNPNVSHLEVFLDAENAALRGNKKSAMFHYERAVLMATRGGFLQDAALANEHFGKFLAQETDNHDLTCFRLQQAIRLYSEWGAHAKAEIVAESFRELLGEKLDAHRSTYSCESDLW